MAARTGLVGRRRDNMDSDIWQAIETFNQRIDAGRGDTVVICHNNLKRLGVGRREAGIGGAGERHTGRQTGMGCRENIRVILITAHNPCGKPPFTRSSLSPHIRSARKTFRRTAPEMCQATPASLESGLLPAYSRTFG